MSQEIVVWSKEYLLTWDDFKAESNPAVFEDSHSYIRYHCTWTINSENIGQGIMFYIENLQIHVHFHTLLSWVRESEISDSLLLHEQGHFDLAEKVRRENIGGIQDVFYNKKFPTRGQNEEQRKQSAKEDSRTLILREVGRLEKVLSQKRREYDAKTNFGSNNREQEKFNQVFKRLR